ncbi:MAG TPA: PaaI family thioesterase [Burkholderiales bacterium]|nr:PaaI family thioesterase [Burkholderiales bacterium]
MHDAHGYPGGNGMGIDDTLVRWHAEEQEVRARLAATGVARADDIRAKSGLQMLEAIFAGELPRPPIGDTLDFVPIRMERGLAVFQGRPRATHYNPLGTVHGGWFATLLDSAVGCAVHTMLPAGKAYTTLELKLNFVRPLTDAVPVVRAEGRVIHIGKQVATAEGKLLGPDGKLYAHATTTCLIFDRLGA